MWWGPVFRRPLQAMLDRHAAAIAVSSVAVSAMARYFTADWEIILNGVDIGNVTNIRIVPDA